MPHAEPVSHESSAIHASGLIKRYGGQLALAGLSLSVERGEVFGFLGPNGAGKTTCVKLLLGLIRPTAGAALVLGRPAGDIHGRRRIGYLPELFRYQPWLRAGEVLAFHCELMRRPRSGWSAEIASALATVGLAGRSEDRVGGLSKGMQQRLGLAVALAGHPELVFLDEPTSALDPVGRHDVRGIIRELRDRGTTVFLNSHLLSEVEQVCDRVAIIDHGRTVAIGKLEDLLSGHTVRIRLNGLSRDRLTAAAGMKVERLRIEAGCLTVHGVEEEQIPDLVSRLVAAGARIYAVESRRASLEDRFLELLEGA